MIETMMTWLRCLLFGTAFAVMVVVQQEVTSQRTLPPSVYKSRDYCLFVINDLGWQDCVEPACVAGDHNAWSVYSQLKDSCTKFCQHSTFGTICEYGDVYVQSKSGLQVRMQCQCNGRSGDKYCMPRRSSLADLFNNNMKGVTIEQARNRCANWCLNPMPAQKNAQHCANFALSLPLANGTTTQRPARVAHKKVRGRQVRKPAPLPVPLGNITCSCAGTGSAEDDGPEIEPPV